MHVTFIVGTRPEIIKVSPVVRLMKAAETFTPYVIATGQHRELAAQAFADTAIAADAELAFATGALGLGQSVAAIMNHVTKALNPGRTDLIIVQGDTNSALAGAMAGFYARLPVAHIEAGLRSGNAGSPFPEEMNRQLIARLAALHFAPTAHAGAQLRQEGVDPETIAITGNTIVDAIRQCATESTAPPIAMEAGKRLLTVTCHRRDNWGPPLAGLCDGLRHLSHARPDIEIVFPMHANPALQRQVQRHLGAGTNVRLLEPLPFQRFLALLQASDLVLTDSGGVQEEALSLNKPVLVCRKETERPEGLATGLLMLVEPHRESILEAVRKNLGRNGRPPPFANPYGDGRAAPRILNALRHWRAGKRPLLAPDDAFVSPAFAP